MSSPSPPRRSQFTLLNLLLLLTTVAAAVGMVAAYRRVGETKARLEQQLAGVHAELADVRAENKRLREDGGYLTIDKADRAYAIRLREQQARTWTYRVFLPPGRNYVVASQVNHLPTGGQLTAFSDGGSLPSTNTISAGDHDSVGTGLPPGEYLITLAVLPEGDDQWKYRLEVRGSGDGNRELKAAGAVIRNDGVKWPATEHGFGTGGASAWQSEHNPEQTLILLDGRALSDEVGSTTADSTEGAMLWIQPNPGPTASASSP
jgi:hypothetical protein